MRLDGRGFSKQTKALRRLGVLPERGFSTELGRIMVTCMRDLMASYGAAHCGYTQSDEMTVLLRPTTIVRGVQQPHVFNGRVQKLCSYAAAQVTARFNWEIQQLFRLQQVDFGPQHLAVFDCRVGAYATRDEAISLLLWRAYDCGVNGVADAVYACKGCMDGAGPMMRRGTGDRLVWLAENDLLPLLGHQRQGTYMVKRKCNIEAIDRKSGRTVHCLRSRIEHVPGNLLNLWKEDLLFPVDDVLSDGTRIVSSCLNR